MNHLQVKLAMLTKGLTERVIAHRLGISQPHLHFMLSGDRPSDRYQGRIARMLGVKKADLFPNGKPRRKRQK